GRWSRGRADPHGARWLRRCERTRQCSHLPLCGHAAHSGWLSAVAGRGGAEAEWKRILLGPACSSGGNGPLGAGGGGTAGERTSAAVGRVPGATVAAQVSGGARHALAAHDPGGLSCRSGGALQLTSAAHAGPPG